MKLRSRFPNTHGPPSGRRVAPLKPKIPVKVLCCFDQKHFDQDLIQRPVKLGDRRLNPLKTILEVRHDQTVRPVIHRNGPPWRKDLRDRLGKRSLLSLFGTGTCGDRTLSGRGLRRALVTGREIAPLHFCDPGIVKFENTRQQPWVPGGVGGSAKNIDILPRNKVVGHVASVDERLKHILQPGVGERHIDRPVRDLTPGHEIDPTQPRKHVQNIDERSRLKIKIIFPV